MMKLCERKFHIHPILFSSISSWFRQIYHIPLLVPPQKHVLQHQPVYHFAIPVAAIEEVKEGTAYIQSYVSGKKELYETFSLSDHLKYQRISTAFCNGLNQLFFGLHLLPVQLCDIILQGLGTVTYIEDDCFGALGHSINDTDTGAILQVSGGEIYEADMSPLSFL